MDDACRDALADVGWKVIPAHVRADLGRWHDLDDGQRQAVVNGISQLGAVLWPLNVTMTSGGCPGRWSSGSPD